jgi:hypothetical protein
MLSPPKRILVEYCYLVVKMVHDNVVVQTTKVNYELLCDVETFLGLTCIMPFVMLVCMASYMMASYGHANHAFRV